MAHTILVIDHDLAQMDLLCRILREKLSYEATGVSNSHAASRYIMRSPTPKLDLILFDISVHAENSSAAIANLRMLLLHTPIVVMVQYGDYSNAMMALGSGAQDFLTKPVAIERLGTTLRNALYMRDAQQKIALLFQDQMDGMHANPQARDIQNCLKSYSLLSDDGNIRRMEQIEAETIRLAMQYYNGHMTEVARRLGIGRSTLYRKLNELVAGEIRQPESVPAQNWKIFLKKLLCVNAL